MQTSSETLREFKIIFNRYRSSLYFYVLKMLYDKILSDDIVQNVFIKLYENIDQIRNKKFIPA
ncbi:MAG: RNA polymerase sigma factor [Bacteroidota bacterium]